MFDFLAQNWGTIVVGLILLAIVIAVVHNLAHSKRQGKNSCECGCENCAASSMCHKRPG
ncbi:MAG: FeoB-associated Cys-rich membrane protein [Hydrogeniiclostridium sp.]